MYDIYNINGENSKLIRRKSGKYDCQYILEYIKKYRFIIKSVYPFEYEYKFKFNRFYNLYNCDINIYICFLNDLKIIKYIYNIDNCKSLYKIKNKIEII